MKQCSNCSHAMYSMDPDQKYCIRFPPIPLMTVDGVFSYFPSVMNYAKCDEFSEGTPQAESKVPPIKKKKSK